MSIIEVNDLKKSYGEIKAVDGISFFADEGKLFAFLGPNGAGKSTTIDILCTLLKPDGGAVKIDGHFLGKDDDAIRAEIGVVFQDNNLDGLLTVRENLYARGSLYGLKSTALKTAADRAADTAGVTDFIDRRYGKLSGGQRRRADIARALVNTPKILFLDEPTTGLDPQTRRSIWSTVKQLQSERNLTVFLTTHYMEEAAAADKVTVIDNGRIAAEGTPSELKKRYTSDKLKILVSDSARLKEALTKDGYVYSERGNEFEISIKNTVSAIPFLYKYRDVILNAELSTGSMDDAFIGITGKDIRE
ncbi:MAG: ATP-binding cassette domain-containing protein [Clostridiales bacterium]|jgi:multidrug/hemolysin transport system ATP-binding protein|nr:ATP-binding cassette domain-containing protein [Clostridiales bacterium]